MTKTFFFDTYALIELIKGNSNYEKYKNANKLTSMLNLLELYYALLLNYNERVAEVYYKIFLNFAISYNEETIKNAAKFRFLNRSKNLSYVDYLGYIMSIENNVKFLTGDKEFKSMNNVEFVK
ncbi:MAG: PIN domain-containing protein [Candidatus Aenigmatarchaeota archaeon]